MRRLALFLILAQFALAAERPKVILAVFAHPDDETFVGPVLARYARQGNDVYIAYATDGQRGTNDFAKIPAGDQLGQARRDEATCACKELGAKLPIFFGIMDGDLGAMTNPLGKNVKAAADGVRKVLDQLHPNAIVTWGPEGGYGHPDHRLISDAVTQVVQQSHERYRLFYVELDSTSLKAAAHGFGQDFMGTDPQYLTVHVSYTPDDLATATRAFRCHKSQYRPEEMKGNEDFLDHSWHGQIGFRPWFGDEKSDDLLK
jgi:LmbE family N-acetylglucosaminyl deacetylase